MFKCILLLLILCFFVFVSDSVFCMKKSSKDGFNLHLLALLGSLGQLKCHMLMIILNEYNTIFYSLQ